MNDYQEIQLNIGLNHTDGNGRAGEFDRELGRFLIENQFNYCGMVSEPYQSEWACNKTGVTYSDSCLAYKISVSRIHAFTIHAIREKVRELCKLLRQDAIAYAVNVGSENGSSHQEVFYVDPNVSDKLEFDPRYFHFVV